MESETSSQSIDNGTPALSSAYDNTIHRSCPLCGKDNIMQGRSLFSSDKWRIKRCANCSFVYLENPPPVRAFEEEFAWEKTSVLESSSRRKREPLLYGLSCVIKKFRRAYAKRDRWLDLIDRYFRPGNLLEVGCGGGGVIARLSQDYTPYGIEISKRLAHEAHQYVASRGGVVRQTSAVSGLPMFGESYFEGVIMSSFLEHEIQPVKVLTNTLRVLKPGGCVVIKVPNFKSINRLLRGIRWCGLRFPDHVNYWTPRRLKQTLEHVGFQIVRFNVFDRFPTNDNMWIVARRPRVRESQDTR